MTWWSSPKATSMRGSPSIPNSARSMRGWRGHRLEVGECPFILWSYLEQLPGYAPELNPDEGIWKHLKYVELKNVCCRSLSELRRELRKAKERLRHKKHVILGCIRQPGFEV